VLKHYIGLPLQIIGALVGLFIYFISESYLKGLSPTSLDYKYVVLVVYVGGIAVIVTSFVYYFVFLSISKHTGSLENISYRDVLASGILLGFVFLPSMQVVLLIEHFIPGIEKIINPFVQISIVIMLMGILSIAITMLIFFILISKKKLKRESMSE
jgi:uncharacterized membrane protein